MTKLGAVALVAVLVACEGPRGRDGLTGPAGPIGPVGARGPQGEPGIPGTGGSGSVVWKDSAGVQVGTGDRLQVLDANGYWWFISAEFALPDASLHSYGPADSTLFFTSTDCTGPYYLAGPLPPPRIPFAYGGRLPWRVRGDAALFQQLVYHSSKLPGLVPCSAAVAGGQLATLMLESDAPAPLGLAAPNLGLTPPLHLERLP